MTTKSEKDIPLLDQASELDRIYEDARRYRWLRDYANGTSAIEIAPMVFNSCTIVPLSWDQALTGEALDLALDVELERTDALKDDPISEEAAEALLGAFQETSPYVTRKYLEQTLKSSKNELRRRTIMQYDTLTQFLHALDGIPGLNNMEGAGLDGCRSPDQIRNIVLQLIEQKK